VAHTCQGEIVGDEHSLGMFQTLYHRAIIAGQ